MASSSSTSQPLSFLSKDKNISMENVDVELGGIGMIQGTIQRLLYRSKENRTHQSLLPSINMAPRSLRDRSPSSFNPRMVSIGPLHRKDENVQAFEGEKAMYLNSLMLRIPSDSSTKGEAMELCVEMVYASMEKIKGCYALKMTYNDDEIAEMMVLDACFILEFIYGAWQQDKSYRGNMLLVQNVYHDLVLLENQIPFFVLDEIFHFTILKVDPQAGSLVHFLLPVLNDISLFKADIKIENLNPFKISSSSIHHILSLLHECYCPQHIEDDIGSQYSSSRIDSALDLDRAGVKFKTTTNLRWMLWMEVDLPRFPSFLPLVFGFWSKPSLRMPTLIVSYYTESVLRNLIAYEQLFKTRTYVTSHAATMDMLVHTQEDVAKLVESKVVINLMCSNEGATNMINNIGKDVAGIGTFYKHEFEMLNNYCTGYWPKHMVRLRRTYFNGPWNIIALVAGIILFGLTVIQTINTI